MSWKKLFGVGLSSSAIVFGATSIIVEGHTPKKWDDDWDKRRPESLIHPKVAKKLLKSENNGDQYADKLKSLESKALRHIILVRHGQYHMDGLTDSKRGLTDLGRQQARQTGKRLRQLNLPYNKVVSSTMQRALETTDCILESIPQIPHTHDDMLVEGAPYRPEPPSAEWKPSAKYLEEGARIEAAFRRYFYRAPPEQNEDSFDVLVCHGNVIRYFVCRVLQFPPEGWLRMSVAHCSITAVTIKPNGRVTLRCLGDTGHLPPYLITR